MTLNLTSIEWIEPSRVDAPNLKAAYEACRKEMARWRIDYMPKMALHAVQDEGGNFHTFTNGKLAEEFVHMRGIRAAIEYFLPKGGP